MLHQILFLALFFIDISSTPVAAITNSTTVQSWADQLASKFTSFLDDTMLAPNIQKLYDDVPVTTTIKQGSVESAAAAARLSTLLNEKDQSLRQFGKMVWSPNLGGVAHETYVIDSAKSIVRSLTNSGDEQITRVYFTPHNDGKTILHSVDGRTDPKENASNIDERHTGWYANAVAGPKDVFIIVDETGVAPPSFDLLKETLHHILNTVSPNDNVWLQRRTGPSEPLGTSSISSTASLLTPLGDHQDCNSGSSRGTQQVVQKLLALSKEMEYSQALASPLVSSAADWIQMFSQTFREVNKKRAMLVNKKRAGCILILSSGNLDSLDVQNVVVPYILEKNVHKLPIIGFHVEKYKDSTSSSTVPLQYTYTKLGTSAWMTADRHASDAAYYYTRIVGVPENDDPLSSQSTSSLHFWGGLFARVPSPFDFFTSNTPNVMSMTRAIFRYDELDVGQRSADARPVLLGVVGFDMNLFSLKDILDSISADLGRTSFPIVVTPFGDTIYHPLQTKFKKKELFDINIDISNYEYVGYNFWILLVVGQYFP